MMSSSRFKSPRISIILILLFAAAVSAAGLEVPALQGRVNDLAGVLSPAKAQEMEAWLAAVEKSTGIQIALLTVPSLQGEVLESYSLKVAETWGLGGAREDNGALLLVAMEERKIRIEVGYGLEGLLTDAASGFIIRETIVPEFRNGNFDRGIEAGLRAIGGVVTGDAPITAEDITESENQDGSGGVPVFILIFFLIFILGRLSRYRRNRRAGMSPLGAFFLGSMLGSASRSGGFSSGRSGGFSGGGFSGGGGGFGGGGASGGW